MRAALLLCIAACILLVPAVSPALVMLTPCCCALAACSQCRALDLRSALVRDTSHVHSTLQHCTTLPGQGPPSSTFSPIATEGCGCLAHLAHISPCRGSHGAPCSHLKIGAAQQGPGVQRLLTAEPHGSCYCCCLSAELHLQRGTQVNSTGSQHPVPCLVLMPA